jgi:hypothetical protein
MGIIGQGWAPVKGLKALIETKCEAGLVLEAGLAKLLHSFSHLAAKPEEPTLIVGMRTERLTWQSS